MAAVSPLVIALLATAVFRRPAHLAALFGIAVTIAVVVFVPNFTTSATELTRALAAAGLISLSAAAVIVPGLYLNQQLTERHIHTRLVEWTDALPLRAPQKSALIVVGVAPALESMTGFGMSLLVTVPLLMAVTRRETALRQSLLSMNIMPWGTLGLATLVGSTLSGQELGALALSTAVVSMLVFPLFGALSSAMAVVNNSSERRRAIVSGSMLGSVFSLALLGMNWLGFVELAGVCAGIATVLVGLWLFAPSKALILPPREAMRPYALIFSLVVLLRVAPLVGIPVDAAALNAGNVAFNPLTSPGIALVATVLILGRGRLRTDHVHATALRAWKPILTLTTFTVMAQVMVASSMVTSISESLPVDNPLLYLFVAVLIGMASGYLTGSGVGGNALMLPMQSGIGAQMGHPLLFSAVQNSAAGHTVFASMPIVLLTLAIAGEGKKGEDTQLVRFSLMTSVGVYAALLLGSAGLYVLL
ncbi:L-lactate permease [Natronoglycomyces albus]|uniref:L-lactate permease n=1 Tax=Natronoglycomyces albus TaxID=2811108 RepID=A0A895XRW4_9ACTN|nr:L-lactate permease [Natronoglycomyces albus]QSB06079.1 L-lactate permease [Natronoglycomyces albus]